MGRGPPGDHRPIWPFPASQRRIGADVDPGGTGIPGAARQFVLIPPSRWVLAQRSGLWRPGLWPPGLWPEVCPKRSAQVPRSPPAAMGAAWFVLSALERLVSPRSRVVEELTRYRDRAIQDFCTQLRPAGHRKHQRVAARCPGRDELVAWAQNEQGRRALNRCHQFKTDGVPVSEPGSIEQRVKLRQLLRACRQRSSDLTGAMVHSVVANVPRYRCVAHDISPPVGLLSAIELLLRQPTQRIIVRSALARSRGSKLY